MRLHPAIVAAALAVAIAGCGGSDEENDPPSQRYGSFFGVAPQAAPGEPDLARMVSGGLGSYHVLMAWGTIERAPGDYKWNAYDDLIGQLARAGLEPAPFLFGTPSIYAEAPNQPPTSSELALDAWADFLRAAAERYGPGGEFWTEEFADTDPDVDPRPVRTWEIWNEPNTSVFWSPDPDPDDIREAPGALGTRCCRRSIPRPRS